MSETTDFVAVARELGPAFAAWQKSLGGDRDAIDPKAVEAKIARAK